MSIPKPTPKEIVVSQRIPTENALRITVSSAGAAEWVEREASQFGNLYPPAKERYAYLLSVADVWDIRQVQAYLASYGATESKEETPIYDGPVFCLRCGSDSVFDSVWRWNGESWEHRCADLDPQVGYEVGDPIADLKRLRDWLITIQDGGEPLPSSLFDEVKGWLRAGGGQAGEVS